MVTTISNPLELYKLLPKSNCRTCGLQSCLAFAAAVIKAQKILGSCPHLEKNVISQIDLNIENPAGLQMAKFMDEFKREIAKTDFPSAAQRLGGTSSAGKMTIKCLGKRFTVDPKGNITSECHINPWVIVPLIYYIMFSSGKEPSGQWVPFRELGAGMIWESFYQQTCEKPLNEVADSDPELFEYLLYVFGGRPATSNLDGDTSLVLYPLPKFPVHIRYSKLENDMGTRLNILFDVTARDNLNIESIFGLIGGLVRMMEKIAARHSFNSLPYFP